MKKVSFKIFDGNCLVDLITKTEQFLNNEIAKHRIWDDENNDPDIAEYLLHLNKGQNCFVEFFATPHNRNQ